MYAIVPHMEADVTTEQPAETVGVVVNLPRDDHKELRHWALDHDITLQDLCLSAIQDLLAKIRRAGGAE